MKNIKKAYCFDDLALIPKYSEVRSRLDVNIETNLTNKTKIKIPIVAANMDTVIGDDLADLLIQNGTYPIFHRFSDLEEIERVAKKYKNNCYLSSGLDYYNIMLLADKYNCKGICIDIAHGHTIMMIETIKKIKEYNSNLEIIAGNVCTPEGCIDLIEAGANAVKIGIGPGAACITRMMTGFGIPQMTTIFECYEVSKKYNIPLIADGGIEIPKYLTMALAGGASSVMIGKLFAQTEESCSTKLIINNEKYVNYRGQASKEFQNEKRGGLKKGTVEEGVAMLLKCSGSAQDLLDKFCGGLKSGCAYAGAFNLNELITKAEFMEVSNNYLKESDKRN
jgi:IMP dehydrogenase